MPKMFQDKDLSTMPKILQDGTSRTFAPPDNTAELSALKRINEDLSRSKSLDEFKKPTDFKMDKFLENKYEKIDLDDVNSLIDRINSEILEKDNIVDLGNDKEIYFRDVVNFLYDIKDGKINNLNKEREYKKRLKNTEKKLANKAKFSRSIRLYEEYINRIKNILFFNKKSSGKRLKISSLPILLSKIYTNNSSKELINDIKQLINDLYNNKQITKQVYNNLIKARTYVRSTNVYDICKNDS